MRGESSGYFQQSAKIHSVQVSTPGYENDMSSMHKSDGYDVRVKQGFRETASIEYEEAGRVLVLSAEWGFSQEDLLIHLSEKVYLPPDYENPLSEARISEIQGRISETLEQKRIPHAFIRHGWTSLS